MGTNSLDTIFTQYQTVSVGRVDIPVQPGVSDLLGVPSRRSFYEMRVRNWVEANFAAFPQMPSEIIVTRVHTRSSYPSFPSACTWNREGTGWEVLYLPTSLGRSSLLLHLTTVFWARVLAFCMCTGSVFDEYRNHNKRPNTCHRRKQSGVEGATCQPAVRGCTQHCQGRMREGNEVHSTVRRHLH